MSLRKTENNVKNNEKANYKAVEVMIHPEFVPERVLQADIALVKLDRDLDFSDREKVYPVCLPGRF